MKKLDKVLLVDDDPASNYLTQMLLEELEIASRIFTSKNGKEALQFLENQCLFVTNESEDCCPDLILLDINMPVMDGFEFLEKFEALSHERNKTIHVVLLTTSTNYKDIERAKQYRILSFLEKPLTEEKIIQIVDAIK